MQRALCLGTLVLASVVLAQRLYTVRGEIKGDRDTLISGLLIELYSHDSHSVVSRTPVMSGGAFEIHQADPGLYEVRIVNRMGTIIYSEMTDIGPNAQPLTLQLPSNPASDVPGGVVHASQLGYHPNRKAVREFQSSQKAGTHGDVQGSIEHLEKAIEIDPEFAPAHHDLGVRFVTMGKRDQAAAEFERAITLDPNLEPGYTNLAVLLMQMGRTREAEARARKAVQLDPASAKAHYLVAVSLIQQHKLTNEVMDHLRRAYDDFPQARVLGKQLEHRLAAVPQ